MKEDTQDNLEIINWYTAFLTFLFSPFSWFIFLVKKDKWSSSTKWTFVLLSLFWPVGLYFLYKKAKQFSKGAKIAISTYFILAFIALITILALSIIVYNVEESARKSSEVNAQTLFGASIGDLAIKTSESAQRDIQKFSYSEIDKIEEIVDMMDVDPNQALGLLYEF